MTEVDLILPPKQSDRPKGESPLQLLRRTSARIMSFETNLYPHDHSLPGPFKVVLSRQFSFAGIGVLAPVALATGHV